MTEPTSLSPSSRPPATFPQVLSAALRTDPGRPFVTFYDEATGERVELSLTTYANWVAKASSLLVDELGLERGQCLRIDLPAHWLAVVFLGAAWNTGLVVTDAESPDAVVCGAATLPVWQAYGAERPDVPVLACSLLPLGVRFADPLPAGVHDVGVEIWGQPDGFTPWDPPRPDDAATRWADGPETSQEELWAAAAGVPGGSRLLSEVAPASPPGTASVTEPLVSGGSLVLVANADAADAARLDAIASTERVTGRVPRGDTPRPT
ncbi:TIGR03089 family protein [Nocardioides sp. DS6]|uniref:TIGR03089 family protein n=1 Tax=Nocardioides eburneus TaxID=3231482 RepID=A0ABV3T714_9ACTN